MPKPGHSSVVLTVQRLVLKPAARLVHQQPFSLSLFGRAMPPFPWWRRRTSKHLCQYYWYLLPSMELTELMMMELAVPMMMMTPTISSSRPFSGWRDEPSPSYRPRRIYVFRIESASHVPAREAVPCWCPMPKMEDEIIMAAWWHGRMAAVL